MKGHSVQSWISLGCASTLGFFMWGLALAVSPLLPIIKEELTLTFSQTGLLFSLPIAMLALFAIPGGFIADRVGIKKATGIGAILVGVGGFMRGTSQDFSMLVFFSTIYGIGWGLGVPNLPKIVSRWFPGKYSGTATGVYSAGIILGVALTLALTPSVIYPIMGEWRGTFYFWGALALAAAAIWWLLAKEPPPLTHTDEKFKKSVWYDRRIWIVAVMLLFHDTVFYGIMGWLPTFMIYKGASSTVGALITSTIMWTALPTSLILPALSDKVGVRKPFYWVGALSLAGLCYLLTVTPWHLDWWLAIGLGVTTTSGWIICLVLPLDFVDSKSIGAASGIVLAVGYTGGLIGPWVSGVILDLFMSYTSVMYFLLMMAVAGAIICYFGIPEIGKKEYSR